MFSPPTHSLLPCAGQFVFPPLVDGEKLLLLLPPRLPARFVNFFSTVAATAIIGKTILVNARSSPPLLYPVPFRSCNNHDDMATSCSAVGCACRLCLSACLLSVCRRRHAYRQICCQLSALANVQYTAAQIAAVWPALCVPVAPDAVIVFSCCCQKRRQSAEFLKTRGRLLGGLLNIQVAPSLVVMRGWGCLGKGAPHGTTWRLAADDGRRGFR